LPRTQATGFSPRSAGLKAGRYVQMKSQY